MEYSIDIDTGGTFTDGFVRGGNKIVLAKVDTTPHDRTVCFMQCIEEAARKLGLASAAELLAQTGTLRLSTTIGTNALIQADGPKLGLLVTKGAGDNVYAPHGQENPAVGFLVPEDMIIGIGEELSASGDSVRKPKADEVLPAVKKLLERGARRIVVSLAGAPLNPAHEKEVRDIVLADYPAHYLGSVPLLLATEISSELNDEYRTNAALINAYIHQEMVRYLYKADDDVRRKQYKWPLLITHATGGAARVAKTKAIDTCDSGPAAGLFGAAFIARLYGLENVITVDVGGTSTDIGLIARGELSYTAERRMAGVPLKERVIETVSIGGGGSSIAWLDNNRKVRVGPDSAGAIPGPACYSLGGMEPAVTDAWLILGYIDPDYFLGGRRKLDKSEAEDAIKRVIAEPLEISVEEAAARISAEMSTQSAHSVKEFIASKGLKPEEVTMFAFGGAGGLACATIARDAGIPSVYYFPFGAQFCAFGSSCTDIMHNYSSAVNLPLEGGDADATLKEFNKALRSMTEDAYFDMEGEGFKQEEVTLTQEVALSAGSSDALLTVQREPAPMKAAELNTLVEQYRQANPDAAGKKVRIKELRMLASSHLPSPEFPEHKPAGESPEKALKEPRHTCWDGEFRDVNVYDQGKLKSGNVVEGLAFVESADTTILVPPGARYVVDRYLNGVLEEE